MGIVELLKVEYSALNKFEHSYHIMNETDKQYKSAIGYGWTVRKSDIGVLLDWNRIWLVSDKSDENQIKNTVTLLMDSIIEKNNKKIENINKHSSKTKDAYSKFNGGV